ncbi:MAG: hypothetical protein JST55_01870 [Bacteroidetes bacterium]|nr:hypothetical protein [Bacteroidota bacterium]
MHNTIHISETNLSLAWVKNIKILLDEKTSDSTTIITSISELDNNSIPIISKIEEELNLKLVEKKLELIENTASTIFPISLWNKNKDRKFLFDNYLKVADRIRSRKRNRCGIYFNRMINYDGAENKANQLDHIISCWNKNNHRFSALQVAIFNPKLDHNFKSQHGFPCLQQLSIMPLGSNGSDGLSIIAYYPKQLIMERAYGNFKGLCHLGQFLAHEMGLQFKNLTCINVKADLYNPAKFNLQDIKDFYNNIKTIS